VRYILHRFTFRFLTNWLKKEKKTKGSLIFITVVWQILKLSVNSSSNFHKESL